MIGSTKLIEQGYNLRSTPELMEMAAVYEKHFSSPLYNELEGNHGYDMHLTESGLNWLVRTLKRYGADIYLCTGWNSKNAVRELGYVYQLLGVNGVGWTAEWGHYKKKMKK